MIKFSLKILICHIIFFILSSAILFADEKPNPNIKIYVNNVEFTELLQPVFLNNSGPLFQLRPLMEHLGFQITWDDKSKSVLGVSVNDTFRIKMDYGLTVVNGFSYNSIEKKLIDGNAYVSLNLLNITNQYNLELDLESFAVHINDITKKEESIEEEAMKKISKVSLNYSRSYDFYTLNLLTVEGFSSVNKIEKGYRVTDIILNSDNQAEVVFEAILICLNNNDEYLDLYIKVEYSILMKKSESGIWAFGEQLTNKNIKILSKEPI